MKYAWIARHRTLWPVTVACEVLEVSASGYFEHCRRRDETRPRSPGVNRRVREEAGLWATQNNHAEVK